MMTADYAISWAKMIAPASASENDVKRIALALLEAERRAREKALNEAAEELETLARRLRGMAGAAREGR